MIEIPGYQILRQLGRGGMATVYLATQESVQRDVALKVMSPSLLVDPDFSERFLREARIAAKLHHRHVVGIHDVSKAGDYNYMAMEYLGGGPVLASDGTARPVGFALRITREIALALHYAHAKGFVHRDVKPDNILLREDNSAALTDFGIARAADSATRMTRTGAVIGTPHYMSPEQARGRTLDGRADLYSLGIVLYELLVGRVPFHADDSLAVGIMHITQPVPVLPDHLSPLQPILNRLLAKQPEDRFQNGQQVADAIEQAEIAIAQGDMPGLDSAEAAYRREVPGATPLPQHKPTTPTAAIRHRSEPSLGRMDDFVAPADRRPARYANANHVPSAPRSRRWIGVLVVLTLLLGGGAAAWHWQDRLRALIPNTELNSLIARGQQALADGKLIGSHGDSARELFQAARSLDADNEDARHGLEKVGARLLEQARAALTRNDFATVRTNLAAAEEVLGGGAEIEQIKTALRSGETHNTATEDLLKRGDAALASGRLLGENSASVWYQKALDADATNALALNGLKKIAEAEALQAHDAINSGNAALANQRIAELTQLSPNHPAIPELRGQVAAMHESDSQALEQQLTRAEAQLRAGKIGTGDDSALVLFQAALKREPANARAKAGLRKIAQSFIIQANAALDERNAANAEKLLQQADALAPDLPDARAAKTRLREMREQVDIASKQAQLTPGDQTRIQAMLDEADKALAAGNLIIPPGDSAYDKYRGVLRIDGNNAKAFAGLNKIPSRAKELFEQAIKDGTPNKARSYVDAIADVDPADASVPPLRERLANVYLDQAEARITQSQRADATRSLNAARELSPKNSRLNEIEQKIQALPAAASGS